jgi:DNA-binding transcriptional LysR family regulator
MRDVHLAALDLNLLPALDALLKRRNVSHAAQDVGLSQPAMSRALARLRDVLGDPLLVRTPGGGYVLSPRAEALSTQLATTIDHVKAVFRDPGFDPAHTQRTIRIAGIDTHTLLLAPTLMARLAEEAPGIDIRFENYSPNIVERVETGQLDLVFATSTTPLPPGSGSETYARDRLALVLRSGHPMAKRRWTVEDYGKVDHVGISILGDAGSEMDAQLAKFGVTRRMALVTPHFIAALAAVSKTDMVTTLSRVFATRFADTFDLILKEPPVPNLDLDLTIVWSHVRAADPVLAWLRKVIGEVAKETMDIGRQRVSRAVERA